MLRELAEGLEALTAEQPLVLLLEDLHWSDPSTVELLAMVARRQESARLLVLGTYRPVDLIVNNHPLKAAKQELVARGQGTEVSLGHLSAEAVHQYVARRLADAAAEPSLAAFIYRRTDGHPLFMVQVTEYLAQHESLLGTARTGHPDPDAIAQVVPDGLRELIEAQLERLRGAERQLLEVASVAGAEFMVASVAAGLQTDTDAMEAICEGLARRKQFIEDRGSATWPDGTVTGCYGFRHALYHDVLRARLGAGQRARLHVAIGTRLAAGYGERTREIAAELALHFEQGGDWARTVRYLGEAGETALRRHGYPEAVQLLSKAITILHTCEWTPERDQQELRLQMMLGPALTCAKGLGHPEVELVYHRARALCRQLGDSTHSVPILWGLVLYYFLHGDLRIAIETGHELLAQSQTTNDEAARVAGHSALSFANFYLGEFANAHAHAKQGVEGYDPERHRALTLLTAHDHGTICRIYVALTRWMAGYPDDAIKHIHEARAMAQAASHPYTIAVALYYHAVLHQFRGEIELAQRHAEAAIAYTREHGFPLLEAVSAVIRGWALTLQGQRSGAIEQIQEGLAALRNTGVESMRPWNLALLAEAYGSSGQTQAALGVIAEALTVADRTNERFGEAELHRLKGELILRQASSTAVTSGSQTASGAAEAEDCFRKAIEITRQQQAKSLELRATICLARLWQQQGKGTEAHRMLAEIYGWFTEGFDYRDLREAKTLLPALTG